MTHPVQYGMGIMHFMPGGQIRAGDHDDRQPQCARGADFGISPRPAGVFRHNQRNCVLAHQGEVTVKAERATVDLDVMVGQGGRCFGRIDETQQVEMLWSRGESGQVHAPDGQHDARGGPVQRGDGTVDIRNMGPIVPRLGCPGRAGQCGERHAGFRTGGNRIPAHLRGKGMRRVNHMGDGGLAQIVHQPRNTAEPANPLWQRLSNWPRDATGKGDRAPHTCIAHGATKRRGFGRAAKNEQVWLHV